MKEELTTKMHKELSISKLITLKNTVFSLLMVVKGNKASITTDLLNDFDLTLEDVDSFYDEFIKLK